jgi:hypothetical protein
VSVVVDDDAQVCAALQQDGWPVMHADWMPRPDAQDRALDQAQEHLGRT